MRDEAFWRGEIDALNRAAIARAEIALRREFARLRASLPADPRAAGQALRAHQARLAAQLGAHGRLTAQHFAVLTARMIGPSEKSAKFLTKAEPETAAAREARIAQVLLALAHTISTGPIAAAIARALGANALMVASVDAAIRSAAPGATPAQIAATLLEDRNVTARLALAAATTMTQPDLQPPTETPASGPANSGAGPSGGDAPPPPRPPRGGGPGGPKRSRFSALVERIVRDEAPRRARRIAATSGRIIAEVLARGAAEGWGEQRIAKALREALGDELALHRARTIARTEMGGGQNGATFAIALDREAAGEELDKDWLANIDGRERESHRDLNRERRPLRERFSNGLMHPHEFGAPAGEVINCRCGMMIGRRLTYTPRQSTPAPEP